MKKVIQLCISEDYYRPLYTFVSAAYILVTFYLWVPIPTVVWDIQMQVLRNAIYGKK